MYQSLEHTILKRWEVGHRFSSFVTKVSDTRSRLGRCPIGVPPKRWPQKGEVQSLHKVTVAPFDFPVQVRAPRSDAAMADPRGLAGEGEGVLAVRQHRRGFGGARIPVRAGTVVVRLHLSDAERKRRAKRRQEGKLRAVRQLR